MIELLNQLDALGIKHIEEDDDGEEEWEDVDDSDSDVEMF